MNIRIITILTSLFAMVSASANVHWLATEHNFGAFNENIGPVTTDFRFVNNGPTPVTILAARASCGCTTPIYTHGDIAVGDTATVSVTYNPAGRPGAFSKYVSVELSDPQARKSKLYVRGTVVGNEGSVARRFPVKTGKDVSLMNPAVMFGQVKKGSLATAKFEAYNSSLDTLRPAVISAPEYIDVDFPPAGAAPGEQFTMMFYFHSDRCPLYGMVTDSVAIDWGRGVHPVPVVAMVEEDFSSLSSDDIAKAPVIAVDNIIDFGTVDSNKKLSGHLEIRNDGKTPLAIRRVYSADPGIGASSAATVIKPGKKTQLTVTVTPEAFRDGMLNARVIVLSNDPRHATVPVRIVGQLK